MFEGACQITKVILCNVSGHGEPAIILCEMMNTNVMWLLMD